jgi:hypothetical protein
VPSAVVLNLETVKIWNWLLPRLPAVPKSMYCEVPLNVTAGNPSTVVRTGEATAVPATPLLLLSRHCVTLEPDKVIEAASAASIQNAHPGICVGVKTGVKARFSCSQDVVGEGRFD